MNNTFVQKVIFCLFFFLSPLADASVQSSLESVQNELVGRLLPVVAILGFIFAGFSFITGNPSARSHLTLAIIGAAVAFGASSIMSLVQSLIH